MEYHKDIISKYLASEKMLLDLFQIAYYHSHAYPFQIIIHTPSHSKQHNLRNL
jgi:hypothetical protein